MKVKSIKKFPQFSSNFLETWYVRPATDSHLNIWPLRSQEVKIEVNGTVTDLTNIIFWYKKKILRIQVWFVIMLHSNIQALRYEHVHFGTSKPKLCHNEYEHIVVAFAKMLTRTNYYYVTLTYNSLSFLQIHKFTPNTHTHIQKQTNAHTHTNTSTHDYTQLNTHIKTKPNTHT